MTVGQTILHAPRNRQAITKLYAVMSVDADGNNGICGTVIPGIGSVPLVFGHDRIHFLHQQADMLSRIAPAGTRIAVFEFSDRKELAP